MHIRFFPLLSAAAALALAAPAAAHEEQPLRFGSYTLTPQSNPEGITVETTGDVETLVVERAQLLLDGVDFADGVIEFDIAFDDRFGFGGIFWHSDGEGTGEYFYIRQHKSGDPDAAQYTPERGGLTSWQLYSDDNGIAPFAFAHEGWNHVRMVIAGDQADIFFNGSAEPVLHVPDLASDRGSGGVGFRATGANGRISIANLTIRPLMPGEGIVGEPAAGLTPPPGIIGSWQVSQPFAESDVANALQLPASVSALPTIATIAAEPSGIADLSRAAVPEEGGDTVLVSARLVADAAGPVRMQFGYSDRLRLFLNGELVFDGVAGWRTRDFFFLGTVGYQDAVVLPLREGENLLQAAVSETFGGWGFAAAIADREGLTIAPAD